MERVLKKYLKNGRFSDVTKVRSQTMRLVKGSNNKTTERRLRAYLVVNRIRGWCIRPRSMLGNPDFWFDREKLAVFVDGCFWHGCPRCWKTPRTNSQFWLAKIRRNRRKDLRVTNALARSGAAILRLWEHELRDAPERCILKILDVVRRRRDRRKNRATT